MKLLLFFLFSSNLWALPPEAFTKGLKNYLAENWSEAEVELTDSLVVNERHRPYAHWMIAQIAKTQNNPIKAKTHYQELLKNNPPRTLELKAQLNLSQLMVQNGLEQDANRNLAKLERVFRRAPEYPEILWGLIKGDIKLKQKGRACKWAKKLYTQYPSHQVVYDWGVDFDLATVDGARLGCPPPSSQDIASRIRNLRLNGEVDRARKEIEVLRKRKALLDPFSADLMLAQFLLQEGFGGDAMALMTPYQETHKNNFNFQMVQAKAAAQQGDVPKAVAAFERAYQISPGSKDGRQALYQAALASYQSQDYEGASQRFQRVIKYGRRSGLVRDAKWNLAWLQYLRGNYQEALKGFVQIIPDGRRAKRQETWERIIYWKSMAQYRLGQYEKARQSFEDLLRTGSSASFYTISARARMSQITALPRVATPRFSKLLSSLEEIAPPFEIENIFPTFAPLVPEESESEEAIAEEEGEELEAPVVAEDTWEKLPEIKDTLILKYFEMAQYFSQNKATEFSWIELREIESRTRSPKYSKMLIDAYESAGRYDRSSLIAERFPNLKHAIYPQAFKVHVEGMQKDLKYPVDFVWAIMRAESHFRVDAMSPVGARGLMQLMPNTGRQVARLIGDSHFSVNDLFVPHKNIRLGSSYLQRLHNKFDGSLPQVAAAYNAGPHRVDAWLAGFGKLDTDEFIEHIPFLETRQYVKRVLKNYFMYRQLYQKDQAVPIWLCKPYTGKRPDKPSTREDWEAS